VPPLPGLLSSLAASVNAGLINCTVDHYEESLLFKLLKTKICLSSRTVAEPKEPGSKDQTREDDQLKTLALVEFQGAIVSAQPLGLARVQRMIVRIRLFAF
jgi:hypothetical protein